MRLYFQKSVEEGRVLPVDLLGFAGPVFPILCGVSLEGRVTHVLFNQLRGQPRLGVDPDQSLVQLEVLVLDV